MGNFFLLLKISKLLVQQNKNQGRKTNQLFGNELLKTLRALNAMYTMYLYL